jgi:hypothetical protein
LKQRLVKTGGSIGEARTVLLVVPGRKSSDATAVRGHGAADRSAAGSSGVAETDRQEEKFINNDIRDGAVFKKSRRAATVLGGKRQREPFLGPLVASWMEPRQIAPKREVVCGMFWSSEMPKARFWANKKRAFITIKNRRL